MREQNEMNNVEIEFDFDAAYNQINAYRTDKLEKLLDAYEERVDDIRSTRSKYLNVDDLDRAESNIQLCYDILNNKLRDTSLDSVERIASIKMFENLVDATDLILMTQENAISSHGKYLHWCPSYSDLKLSSIGFAVSFGLLGISIGLCLDKFIFSKYGK